MYFFSLKGHTRGQAGAVVRASDFGPRGSWFKPRPGAVGCGLEQVTFTPCLVLVKSWKQWTDYRHRQTDEAGDYVVPNVLSPRDLVSRPDNMDETVPHTRAIEKAISSLKGLII